MSWWISLIDDRGESVRVGRFFAEGGTYAIGGEELASLNVTYNYGNILREAMEDPDPHKSNVLRRLLHGKRAGDTIDMLKKAVGKLGVVKGLDYWEPTPGNVGHALDILLHWAEQYPDAHWRVN